MIAMSVLTLLTMTKKSFQDYISLPPAAAIRDT